MHWTKLSDLGVDPASTAFERNRDYPDVLEFRSVLRQRVVKEAEDDGTELSLGSEAAHLLGPEAAYLEGFAYFPGYVPGEDGYESADYDIFDARSGHTAEGFDLLVTERKRIAKAAGAPDFLDLMGGIIFYERGFVDPAFRGKRLVLHLMNEVRHVFGAASALIMLKAHPDGDEIGDAECRRLAKYYQSDDGIGLRPISSRKLPGWLVAQSS